MRFFDRMDPGCLERRVWQLWILALTTILVLATGLALMMYTIVFSKPVGLAGHTFVTLFVGYCVLMPLLIGYLIDRQFVIKQLRHRIREEEEHITILQDEFRSSLLETLPGLTHFQDRLAMEHRRASRAEQPLSLIMVGVEPSSGADAPSNANPMTVFGEAAKALTRKLRGKDSLYHFGGGIFGILLPRVPTSIANLVVEQLKDGMLDTVSSSAGFKFEIGVTNFPDQAASAWDIEKAVMNFLSTHGHRRKPEQVVGVCSGYHLESVRE